MFLYQIIKLKVSPSSGISISSQGSRLHKKSLVMVGHIFNRVVGALLDKYRVKYKVTTQYDPQTSGQVKVLDKKIKSILEKFMNFDRTNWAQEFDDVL